LKKVLHIVNRWSQGGVERFIENVVSACDDDISHSIASICTEVRTDARCDCYGCLGGGVAGLRSFLYGAEGLKKLLNNYAFDVVHIHTNNSSGFLYAYVAKKCGIGIRVVHSHNSSLGADSGLVKKTAHSLFRVLYAGNETVRIACSKQAGEHLFLNKKFSIVPNGINVELFAFDEEARKAIRSSLGVEDDEVLVGCIGSFVATKNHARAIDILLEARRMGCNCKMLILGEGELRAEIEKTIVRNSLQGVVVLMGFVKDIHRFYNAMDVMLFPSLYEGFPVSLVEAQCNGLPVVSSRAVTEEVALTPLLHRVALSESNDIWVKGILSSKREAGEASKRTITEKGYSNDATAEILKVIYTELDE
jgi:glycosyltransferase involved in cell wall biosynthesis